MTKKKYTKAESREEAIENLVCAAIRLCYPIHQISWDMENSLVKTRLVYELRIAIRELKDLS